MADIPGLVGFWALDDGEGVIAIDDSGNGNDGSLVNAPTWVDGKSEKCLSCDGTNQYLTCGDLSGLVAQNGPATISAWFFFTKLASDTGGWLGIHTQLQQHPAENRIYLREIGGDYFDVGSLLSINTWYHIALTYNGTHETSILYINKTPHSATIVSPEASHAILNPFNIGNTTFPGLIDEIRLYNRVLAQEEIDFLFTYPNGVGPGEPEPPPVVANTLEQALYEHTLEISTVTAIVADRIFFDEAPETVKLPYVVIDLAGGPKEAFTQGDRNSGMTRMEWNCFHSSQWSAHILACYIRDNLYEYRGLLKGIMIEETRMSDLRMIPSMNPGIYGYRTEAHFRWTI